MGRRGLEKGRARRASLSLPLGSRQLYSLATVLGQQGAEPWLRVCVVSEVDGRSRTGCRGRLPRIPPPSPRRRQTWNPSSSSPAAVGVFGIFNGPDEATLNRIMVQHPFFPYSLITVRPILDGDTALGQWREIMSEGMGAGPAV